MVRYISHLLLLVGGTVAGWFWDVNAPNFAVIQMATTMLIFTGLICLLTFWPYFWWLKLIRNRRKGTARK